MIILYPESLIDKNNPGFIENCIGVVKDPSRNIVEPITGKHFLERAKKECVETKTKLKVQGAYYLVNEGNFIENIEEQIIPENAIPRLLAEMRHDGLPPMFMKLNSSKKTPSGDYEINFSFTYIDDNNIYLNTKAIKIHVKSKLEIYGIFGLIMSFVAFVLSLNITRMIIDYLGNALSKIIMNIKPR